MRYQTIRSSKGQEADHGILLRADSGRMGFPSEIVDDPLLSLVSPESEPFENAVERRVMSVAVTRARLTLTALASEARPSSFVKELLADPSNGVSGPTEAKAKANNCGECAGRLIYMPAQDGSAWYRCEHVQLCGNRLPACPSCSVGLPRHQPGFDGLVCFQCGSVCQACPSCADGWLVERSGPYGEFFGCARYPECLGKARTLKWKS
ncbi:topoisomerase DNA-binding C4 zinc finger domain-containing protein [Rhodobacter sp. Har01]|uniref:topoisomerase DNA-binding C4 zinc finger domain-containing protein n=1 Tax=Rhodobacter sp. Har01 TaxID=2883999 RepID=UPI001D07FC1A|nr:topoisomerase DNA-binding C4 zinc finger domain-containing protein [Rhodobacter sp. Har01]MCB6180086.1 topoisomerase DNA-binding C4 zinc finger domain-containing protein [Rhodobacter sp. Har01]